MITTEEMNRIIFSDKEQLVENEGWIERFYDLLKERYYALNTIKLKSNVLKLEKDVLLQLVKNYHFDEMHLFKVHEEANVFALLKKEENGYWHYEFVIIYKDKQDVIVNGFSTVEDIKRHFKDKEPILEIPLPHDRKYSEN